jgi:hypothetical protein
MIELAIREALKDCDRYDVWDEPLFKVSHTANNAFTTSTSKDFRFIELPYGDGPTDTRPLQVDLIVYDRAENIIRAYEVKRGVSYLGDGEHSDTARKLALVQMLLKSYALTRNLTPIKAETHLISYYGAGWSAGECLSRDNLDKHFSFPVVARVEEATANFRAQFQKLIAEAT